MKHTHGPWEAGKGKEYDNLRENGHVGIMAGNDVVASSIARVWADGNSPEADARLIAAAPELLAALETFEEIFGEDFDNDAPVNGSDCIEWVMDMVPQFRLAIANATQNPERLDFECLKLQLGRES